MFRRNTLLRVSSQWPETVGAAMVRKRAKTNQVDLEAQAAAEAAQQNPSYWQQFWDSDIVVGTQDYMWTNFGLGAADVTLHSFAFVYIGLCYYDQRTRFHKSRFSAFMTAFIEFLPYYIILWFFKKYICYLMDVPVLRGGESSSSSSRFIAVRRNSQGMNDETGEVEYKTSKTQMRQDTEMYEARMKERMNEKKQ